MKEGCLTYPFVFLDIERPRKCVMKYEDAEGKTQEAHLDGMMSRICQHEYDHIEGVLFVDYLKPLKKKLLQKRLRRISEGKISVKYRMRFPKLAR